MANFDVRNLSPLSYAQGFTLWLYRHSGSVRDVLAPNFFDYPMANNDHMHVTAQDGGIIAIVVVKDTSIRLSPMGMGLV